jgi:hypothetical protein
VGAAESGFQLIEMSEYLQRLGAQGHLRVKAMLRSWDPIGVYGPDSDAPNDEYDSYSAPIVCMLDSGAGREAIVVYLESVCLNSIEVPFDRRRTEILVEELIAFWLRWQERVRAFGPDHIDEQISASGK